MSWIACTSVALLLLLLLLLAPSGRAEPQQQPREEAGIVDCVFEANSVACARRRMAREIDRIESQVTGRASEVPMSKVIEEGASLIADGVQAIFGPEQDESGSDDDGVEIEESRKKKFFKKKKKKKHLHKLIMIGMLLKSKIGLLLQLLSTHFQVKFFAIAILSLAINAARFWFDLKKSYRPSKVIYYEHAQHQHHYDHDDDYGIWGRSSHEAPQELAYNAYAPDQQ